MTSRRAPGKIIPQAFPGIKAEEIEEIISKSTVMELCESFFSLSPPTRIRLRDETLSGTLDAVTSGQADLALGVAHWERAVKDSGYVAAQQTVSVLPGQ